MNCGMNPNNFMNNMNMINGNFGMMPQMNNMNYMNNMNMGIFEKNHYECHNIIQIDAQEKVKDLIIKYRNKTGTSDKDIYLYNACKLDPNDESTIATKFGRSGPTVKIIVIEGIRFDIRMLKSSLPCTKIYNGELKGLSMLCFLKEISSKLESDQLDKLPEKINLILSLLKNRDINSKFINNNDINENIKNEIKEMLNKINGINVVNFQNF